MKGENDGRFGMIVEEQKGKNMSTDLSVRELEAMVPSSVLHDFDYRVLNTK